MIEDDDNIKHSPLGQSVTSDGKTVQVEIYEDGEGGWLLEVVDEYGNSTCWDNPFETDQEALDEVLKTIKEDGIESLIGAPDEAFEHVGSNISDTTGMMAPLSEEEFEELDDFLMSDAAPNESMIIDSLDGYLTAIVIGPTSIPMSDWLPGVWGTEPGDRPVFQSKKQAQHLIGLILRLMNSIVTNLEVSPDSFEPIFSSFAYEDSDREYLDGESWAYGFWQGIDLCRQDWLAFFKDHVASEVLRPIRLLGADEVTPAEEALTETPEQREELTKKIPGSVASIYRYWLPYRKAVHERLVAETYQREQPKIGRNDPCPCGSGKKFKKCCGAASLLH